ncbi:MAG: BlaI/MecI/CopY family transcriptional regulator [Phycisphaerae bacterium]|nr:BlaI/MecI/CopY family transcriptional regulator [Phycisphaerae bacterium]
MTQKNLIPLSPAETEILRIVWELDHPTVQAVWDALPDHRDIAYATVQTLLRRLEKKGYLDHQIQGKAHVFHAKIRQKDVIGSAVQSFVDRLFGGDAVPLVQFLAENRDITKEDISRLSEILEDQS